jgi:endonuclease/exonuclease/phosphatase family metal-dependent hydrolase
MARKSDANAQVAQQLIAMFMKLPWKVKVAIGVLVLVAGGVAIYLYTRPAQQPTPPPDNLPPGAKTVVFCLWNMENLFDDKDDKRRSLDEPYDTWFVEDAEARKAKYAKLAAWLLKQNGGIGPDVIVGNEIESRRAAELLQQELNAGLPEGAVKFNHVAMEELDGGRHIAPCVISRYPLSGAKLLEPRSRMRILEVHVTANKYDLVLVASHWTSQLTDRGDKEDGGRNKYATIIYDHYAPAVKENPKLDYLVCGDFNDTPDSESVANKLHLTGDAKAVTADANPPKLFGPLSGKDPMEFGTHYYNKPLIYDHVGLSPGMLDEEGWGYLADSVKVPTDGLIRTGSKGRRPWRYGSKSDTAVGRGYSDHFPVMVTLKVAP